MQPNVMTKEQQERLVDWWESMNAARPTVRRLCSLVSELRMHPEASHADGMILFYRAASEVSYGHAGTRGGIRRALDGDFTPLVQANMVMCFGVVRQFSEDARVLLEHVSRHVDGANAQQIIKRIRNTLQENDVALQEAAKRAQAFFGAEQLQALQLQNKRSMML